MIALSESVVEEAVLDWFRDLGYNVIPEAELQTGPGGLRESYADVLLPGVVRGALDRLNPELPPEALDDAFRKLTRPEGASLEIRNRALHSMLVNGITVEYRRDDGSIGGAQAQVVDFERPNNNDRLVINQFTVVENKNTRRPDVIVFLNGLPLFVLELKNPADEDATVQSAQRQIETYKVEIPSLFTFNEAIVISDGVEARVGTLTAGYEWFKPRTRTICASCCPSMAEGWSSRPFRNSYRR